MVSPGDYARDLFFDRYQPHEMSHIDVKNV